MIIYEYSIYIWAPESGFLYDSIHTLLLGTIWSTYNIHPDLCWGGSLCIQSLADREKVSVLYSDQKEKHNGIMCDLPGDCLIQNLTPYSGARENGNLLADLKRHNLSFPGDRRSDSFESFVDVCSLAYITID